MSRVRNKLTELSKSLCGKLRLKKATQKSKKAGDTKGTIGAKVQTKSPVIHKRDYRGGKNRTD